MRFRRSVGRSVNMELFHPAPGLRIRCLAVNVDAQSEESSHVLHGKQVRVRAFEEGWCMLSRRRESQKLFLKRARDDTIAWSTRNPDGARDRVSYFLRFDPCACDRCRGQKLFRLVAFDGRALDEGGRFRTQDHADRDLARSWQHWRLRENKNSRRVEEGDGETPAERAHVLHVRRAATREMHSVISCVLAIGGALGGACLMSYVIDRLADRKRRRQVLKKREPGAQFVGGFSLALPSTPSKVL